MDYDDDRAFIELDADYNGFIPERTVTAGVDVDYSTTGTDYLDWEAGLYDDVPEAEELDDYSDRDQSGSLAQFLYPDDEPISDAQYRYELGLDD
jgi:hypothetical protein